MFDLPIYPTWKEFLRYRIVEIVPETFICKLQCVYLRTIFQCPLQTLATDMDLISGLSPQQSALLGLEYGQWCLNHPSSCPTHHGGLHCAHKARYGKFQLIQENRDHTICILNKETNDLITLLPRQFMQNNQWVEQIDANQAFYIGYLASLSKNYGSKTHSKVAVIIPFRRRTSSSG